MRLKNMMLPPLPNAEDKCTIPWHAQSNDRKRFDPHYAASMSTRGKDEQMVHIRVRMTKSPSFTTSTESDIFGIDRLALAAALVFLQLLDQSIHVLIHHLDLGAQSLADKSSV
jgi:hypothetical protein